LTIQSKLPNVGTTIFTVMSALASEHDAVNLGQGFPDFQMNEELIELVNKAMRDGFNQYAPMPGWLPLRESIARKVYFLYETKINPASEITVTPGGTYAVYSALTSILDPGDEVIVFEPAYDSYIPNIEINGAKAVLIKLEFPGYRINWEEVKTKINSKTKAILLNSPNNPASSVLREEDIEALKSVVAETNIFIVSDEVYEHIVFDGLPHLSMLRYPELYERSFTCFSFGKVYNCTGWKLGYCIAPPKLTREFRKVHQFNSFSCHTPSQVALAKFLASKDSYLSLGYFLQEKRDYFIELMRHTKFELLESKGSYFIPGSFKNISDESDVDFAKRITKEFGVATIPLSAFYQDGKDDKVVRFCFAKKKSTLEEAVEKLSRI
jgi:methionine aminotransferase